jgi:hypothetical protein
MVNTTEVFPAGTTIVYVAEVVLIACEGSATATPLQSTVPPQVGAVTVTEEVLVL